MKTLKLNLKNLKINVLRNKSYHRHLLLSCMFFLCTISNMFAGNVDGKLNAWKTKVQGSLNAAVGIFAIVGGFIVFMQYMQGSDSAQKNFIKFVIGLGIFGLAALIPQALT